MKSILLATVFALVVSEIHCIEPEPICQGEEYHINCDTSLDVYKKVHIIDADYGRSEKGVCKGPLESDLNTNCHAENSLEITRQECEGFASCTVYANNDEYGNPCPLTKKYLTVSHECVKAKPNVLRKVRVCQGHQNTIACPTGRKIDIEYAMYGRLKGGHVCGGIIFDTNCVADNSLAVVQADCQGERTCLLEANDDKFEPGLFFCVGTSRYLEVHYRCRKA